MLRKSSVVKIGLLVLCLIVLLASQVTGKKLHVLFADWNDAARLVIENQIIADFEKDYPDYEVVSDYTSWGREWDKLITGFQAGTSPDLFHGGGIMHCRLAYHGWSMPLNDFIAQDPEFNWDDFFPVAREDTEIEGEITGIPYRIDVRPFLYRESILEEVGVAPPDTWDEAMGAAVKCTKREDGKFIRAGFNFFNTGPGNFELHTAFLAILYQGGGRYLNEEKTASTINGPGAVKALKFLDTLVNELEVMPPPVGMELIGGVPPICIGKAAMTANGVSVLFGDMKRYNPAQYEDLKAKPQLIGPGGRYTHAWVNKLHISSQTEHPKIVWELLKRFVEPKYFVEYCKAYKSLPTRISMTKMPFIQNDPGLVTAMEAMDYAITHRHLPYVHNFWDPINQMIQNTLYRVTTPEQAADRCAKQMNRIIDLWEAQH